VIDRYTEPWARALSDPKHRLERAMEKAFEFYIRTTRTPVGGDHKPEIRSQYNFGAGPTRTGSAGRAWI